MAFFGLIKSRRERDLEAEIKSRQGRNKIVRFVQQSRKAADRYWALAKQAFQLGDQEQFQQLAIGYLRINASINRWERYLIKLDALEMRRNEVASTGEFLRSMTAMTQSILRGANPEEIARMQVELEKAVCRTDALEETLDIAMEAAGNSLTGTPELSDDVLEQITAGIESESSAVDQPPDSSDLDARIASALKKVETRLHDAS